MGTAGNSDEVRQMATAMVALDHSGWQQQWSASNVNVEWQRQWSASNGNGWQRQLSVLSDGNGVLQVAMAGKKCSELNEVC